MFVRILALPLVVQLAAATDGVPKYDVTPSCEGAARANYMTEGNDRLQSCIASENNTRDVLAKNWSSFPADDRTSCMASMSFGPTYTELATCLEMKRDLRNMRKPVTDSSTPVRVPGGTHRQPRSQ